MVCRGLSIFKVKESTLKKNDTKVWICNIFLGLYFYLNCNLMFYLYYIIPAMFISI